jgi:hypothetical protein
MRHVVRVVQLLLFILIISFCMKVSQAYSGALHVVTGTLKYADDTYPTSVTFSAYLLKRPGEVLTQSSYGCESFPSSWLVGDVLRVEFNDGAGKMSSVEVFLTSEDADYTGVVVLTQAYHHISISIPDTSAFQGSTIDVPVRIEGLTVLDSVVAYQIQIGFQTDVVQAVGVTNEGTMTEMWDVPFVNSEEGMITVGGLTTNQPSKRLVSDHGILVKITFLVQGIPFENTLLWFSEAVIFALEKTIPLAHTGTGMITVEENPFTTDTYLTLHPGGNMIGLAMVPENPAIPELLNDLPISYIFGFQSDQDPPKSWEKGRPINDLEYLDGIHGYWMKLDTSETVLWEISGNLVSVVTPIPVYKGWNLIGYLPQSSDSIAHAFQMLAPNYSYVLGYQGGEGPKTWVREREPDYLNDLHVLTPLSGYWLKMDSTQTLVYPSGGYTTSKVFSGSSLNLIQQDSTPQVYVTPWWCDFWCYQPTLLLKGDIIHVFDSDGVLCGETQVNDEGAFLVHVFGDDGSTDIKDEGAETGEEMHFTVNNQLAEVVAGDPTWIDRGSKQVGLQLDPSKADHHSELQIPKRMLLKQNYPNPFNSETVIPYHISKSCKVNIDIYDISGRLVCQLLSDTFQQPGEWHVVWNGRDANGMVVTSGIYFYLLHVDSVKQIRKMIFLE